jgi:alkanesulfonate monooxygenase SsuD/methylene tetrahydromethanopterin reductase-like flavin-dependent oxidoreductase (luciferase family)
MRAKVVRKAGDSTSKSGTLAHMGNRVPLLKYGVSVANFGTYSDPARFVELAEGAENAGWEGVFVWDHLAFAWGRPTADPWILLAAAASATDRVLLGTLVTPLPRRRPHMVAVTVATVDRLSGGRVLFGAGLGGNERELTAFGEETDEHVRAEKLDEALDLLRRWWNGERVTHRGAHYTVDDVAVIPTPLQSHLPIWIGGDSWRARNRAGRFDGWAPNVSDGPQQLMRRLEGLERAEGFDVVVQGDSDRTNPDEYSQAGATWWLDSIHDQRGDFDAMLRRVGEGPPR